MVAQPVPADLPGSFAVDHERTGHPHVLLVVGAGELVAISGLSDVAVDRTNALVQQLQAKPLLRVFLEGASGVSHGARVDEVDDRALVSGAQALSRLDHLDAEAACIPAIVARD